jgi:DNA-directed RNA polymerase specialized sigma24 family protein
MCCMKDTLRTGLDLEAGSNSTTTSGTNIRKLRQLAGGLPPGLRDVWQLHVQGLTHEQIAERLDIKVGAAYTRLSRARAALIRRMLDGG